ncbi:pentapeptide repeat-containing protein [Babesia caballi]|uniref:Pentapeptide repeat-containing protein n=1 Tax=Babesia caballi TaxID=5871 RepID=A0AAV4LS39_BABCB|nr:pentapeptide repeat-containing protein [Babesia caballi]
MFSLETLLNNILQRGKNSIQYTIICHTTLLNLTIKPLLHLIPNPLHQLLKAFRHLTGAHALSKLPNNFQNNIPRTVLLQLLNHTKPLEEPDDKVQHGVADLVLCHVRGNNAAAGDYGSGTTLTIIPNKLPKSVGQLGNKAITGTIQSHPNLLNLLTKLEIRLSNFFEKILNLVG